MEIAGAVVGESTQSTIVHVEREFGYLIHFRRTTNTLKDKIEELTTTRSHVQELMDAARRNGELVNAPVKHWMRKASLVLVQATKVSNEANVIKGWFRGWCCGRFSLGRKAEKEILAIQGLCAEERSFSATISCRKPTQDLELLGAGDFTTFASRDYNVGEIRRALLDDATNLVGVYGMPGVGKTTLIKEIAKQVKEEQLFLEVVVVIVSQNNSLIKLQGDIAKRLDLNDLGDDLSTRAERLYERLNQDDKTTLVILDDVWERIELFEVGIPYKNNGKCCKVVFTTRFESVCDTMEANIKMEVAVISDEDSWILFQQKAGNVPDFSIARDVLMECKGLPLAIVTLGLALRNKDAKIWADALEQLRKSIFFEGMSPVNSSIKLSYNFLEGKSIKICFLFCCLFPEDHEIELDALLNYMMGEKLIEDVDTYEEARGRLYSMLYKLASSGMLLRNEKGRLLMHDVVRDVAISIGRGEEGFIVKAGRNVSEWPDMELVNCRRLSIMHNSIKRLPTTLIKAPNLQTLFLNDNKSLTKFPADFFVDMKSLMTLDLSNTSIKYLPPSLACLGNLRTLLLNHTPLRNLLHVYGLERLEILSLRYLKFTRKLLEEIGNLGNLSNLRILDLTAADSSSSSPIIRPAVILKLRRLEEIHVLQMVNVKDTKVDIFREIGSLSRLTSLELQVHNPELCQIDIPGPWQNLRRFRIVVSTEFLGSNKDAGFSRSLWLHRIGLKQVLANWVLVLLGRTNYLELQGCDDIQSLTEFGVAAAKGMNENLKSLNLRFCSNMECLISSTTRLIKSNQNSFFSNLEELSIEEMSAFVEICKGTPPPGLLHKLKTLTFKYCHRMQAAIPRKLVQNLQNLEYLSVVSGGLQHVVQMEEEEESVVASNSNISRLTISEPLLLPRFSHIILIRMYFTRKIRYVFTMSAVRNLLQLEQLDLSDCDEMEVILKYEDGENILFGQDTVILPRLRWLTVRLAPKLTSFTNQNIVMEFPSLLLLNLHRCGMLERLPFGATSVPNLKKFEMDQEIFDKLEWEDESVKARLQPILNINQEKEE